MKTGLDRERYERMIRTGKGDKTVPTMTRLKPEEILRLDDLAKKESRSLCGLLAYIARQHIDANYPWRWA